MQDYAIDLTSDGGAYLRLSADKVSLGGVVLSVQVQVLSNVEWRVNGPVDAHQRGDLLIRGGDFFRDDALERSVFLILSTMAGAWKNAPITGAGLIRFRNSALTAEVARAIEVQMKADGYPDARVSIEENTITITV